jgi:hypothetical protein
MASTGNDIDCRDACLRPQRDRLLQDARPQPGFDVLPTDDPKSVDAEAEEMREKWLAFDCVAEVVVLDEPGLRMAWWSLLGESALVFSDRSGPQTSSQASPDNLDHHHQPPKNKRAR